MSALSQVRSHGRFATLTFTLLAMFVTAPFVEDEVEGVSRMSILYTVVMLSGVYAISRRRVVFLWGLTLAVPALILEWLANFVVTASLVMANLIAVGIFIAYIAGVVFYEVLDEDRITVDTILGGVCIYLLIGALWVTLYAAIEYDRPGSFLIQGQTLASVHPELQVRFPEFLYFSFVTMTTLGYGDIVPATPPARAMSAGEAVVGQLYIAIFVARLVGLHLVHQQRDRPEG